MTGQLLKVTTTPFQAVRVSQGGRLVSSDSIDIERRKAIARMKAFESQHSLGNGSDLSYINKINRTFAVNSSHRSPALLSVGNATGMTSGNPSSVVGASASISSDHELPVSSVSTAANEAVSHQNATASVAVESNSAYTVERGAFEMRVAQGNLAFIPPLVMTVITQRPEVHFEYIGGYNYLPPLDSEKGAVNLSI